MPRLLVSLLLSLALLGCDRWQACRDLPTASGVCGGYKLADDPDGPWLCACPVEQAESGSPVCESPDPRALLAAAWVADEDPDRYHFGTWPDLSGLDEAACPQVEDMQQQVASFDDDGSLTVTIDNRHEHQWVEPTPSPDGAFFAMFVHLSAGWRHYASLAACGEGGWLLERFLGPLTAPFVRWGVQAGEQRHLYVVDDDLFRVTVGTTLQTVTDGNEANWQAVTVERAELLARSEKGKLAIGDFDVLFDEDESGVERDRYAVFMSGLDASWIPLYVEAGIYVMDLTDCRADCEQDEDLQFCCRTAFLVDGNSDNPDIPTNPSFSPDGSLLVFNRFTSSMDDCPLGLCAQEHVLRNPLADPELFAAWCTEDDGRDGFHQPIDCSALVMEGGRWSAARCPDWQCCSQGADCANCLSIGEAPGVVAACELDPEGVRERNYEAFFQLEDRLFLSFRSQDLLGDEEQEYHIYEIQDADGRLAVVDLPIGALVANGEGTAFSKFGTGPWHRSSVLQRCP